MLLPLGDSPNPRSPAYVTWAILGINIIIHAWIAAPLSWTPAEPTDPRLAEFVDNLRVVAPDAASQRAIIARLTAYDLYVFEHGFRPAAPSLRTLFASMFLHGSLLHLFGNMLFLWIYGNNVEHRLGHVRFLVAYLATGIAATLFYAAFAHGSGLPLVGASGAISGVLGFYFVWFPHNRIRVLILLFPFLMQRVEVPARLVLLLYLVADNLLPFLVGIRAATSGGVAHGAHIGGFIAGVGIALYLNRKRYRR